MFSSIGSIFGISPSEKGPSMVPAPVERNTRRDHTYTREIDISYYKDDFEQYNWHLLPKESPDLISIITKLGHVAEECVYTDGSSKLVRDQTSMCTKALPAPHDVEQNNESSNFDGFSTSLLHLLHYGGGDAQLLASTGMMLLKLSKVLDTNNRQPSTRVLLDRQDHGLDSTYAAEVKKTTDDKETIASVVQKECANCKAVKVCTELYKAPMELLVDQPGPNAQVFQPMQHPPWKSLARIHKSMQPVDLMTLPNAQEKAENRVTLAMPDLKTQNCYYPDESAKMVRVDLHSAFSHGARGVVVGIGMASPVTIHVTGDCKFLYWCGDNTLNLDLQCRKAAPLPYIEGPMIPPPQDAFVMTEDEQHILTKSSSSQNQVMNDFCDYVDLADPKTHRIYNYMYDVFIPSTTPLLSHKYNGGKATLPALHDMIPLSINPSQYGTSSGTKARRESGVPANCYAIPIEAITAIELGVGTHKLRSMKDSIHPPFSFTIYYEFPQYIDPVVNIAEYEHAVQSAGIIHINTPFIRSVKKSQNVVMTDGNEFTVWVNSLQYLRNRYQQMPPSVVEATTRQANVYVLIETKWPSIQYMIDAESHKTLNDQFECQDLIESSQEIVPPATLKPTIPIRLVGSSSIVQSQVQECLQSQVSKKAALSKWTCLYSLLAEGAAMEKLWKQVGRTPYTLWIIRDATGAVFGGYAGTPWIINAGYQGNYESFIFRIETDGSSPVSSPSNPFGAKGAINGEVQVHCWQQHIDYHLLSDEGGIGWGGGGGLGLFIDNNLRTGKSEWCGSYLNPPLTNPGAFHIYELEVWGGEMF